MKLASTLLVLTILRIYHATTTSYERQVHEKIMKGYHPNILPAREHKNTMLVEFEFVLEEVESLDVKEQSLEVNAFTTLRWTDPQLSWNASQYGGVDETNFDPDQIWIPDISLYNTDDLKEERGPRKNKIRLRSNGRVIWVNYRHWKSSCSTDVTWWPYDVHTCHLKFGSWLYDRRHLHLKMSQRMHKSRLMKAKYHDVSSGEWKTTFMNANATASKFRCCANKFSTIVVSITLERMPLYYVVYMILPLCALVLAYLLIFHLDGGQRASYGVTILLSISVNLLVITESLPRKSDDYPFIGMTFIFEFFLLCLALPVAEYMVHISNRSEYPPPAWLHQSMIRVKEIFLRCRRIEVVKSENKNGVLMKKHESSGADAGGVYGTVELAVQDYQKQWYQVSRFLDYLCNLFFLFLIVIIPLIICASL